MRKKRIIQQPEVVVENIEEKETIIEEKEEMWGYDVKVTAIRLRTRESPNSGAKVVALIQDHGIYRVVKEENGWGQLKDGSWIMLKYTEKVQNENLKN